MFRTAIITLTCVACAVVAHAGSDSCEPVPSAAGARRDKSNDSPRANEDGAIQTAEDGQRIGQNPTVSLIEDMPVEHPATNTGPLPDVDLSATHKYGLAGLKEARCPDDPFGDVKVAALHKLEHAEVILSSFEFTQWRREMEEHQIELPEAALAVFVAWRIKHASGYYVVWAALVLAATLSLWAFWPQLSVFLKRSSFSSKEKN